MYMSETKKLFKSPTFIIVLAFLLGIFWVLAVRFVLLEKTEVHYHANFGVFINGQREEFKEFTNYEEIQACSGDAGNNPKTRTHMHDQLNSIIHVHDNAATWGHFFANVGFVLGPDSIQTRNGVFTDGVDGNKLVFKLNGQVLDGAKASNLYNTSINSEDLLLISYGSGTEDVLNAENDQIVKNAAEYNQKNDPSSCSGGKPLTFSERLKTTLKFWE